MADTEVTARASEASARARTEGETLVVALSGAWRAAYARRLQSELDKALRARGNRPLRFDLAEVSELDTVGAWLLVKAARQTEADGKPAEFAGASEPHARLIARLGATEPRIAPRPPGTPLLLVPFVALGRVVINAWNDLVDSQAMQGRILTAFGSALALRGRLRPPAFVNQFDLIALQAVPIVVLISVVVGAIITQQSILQLRPFGAQIFVVDLGAILMFREVGLLLAAIMVAGRSGSAITAELGSMRMREEIDALQVMGVDPYQALILPRMLALVLGLPLLAFIGSLAGIAGTAVVARYYGGVPFDTFLDRLQDALNLQTLMVGLVKAPVMAFIIGLIAANEGFKVEGSAESLGRHTTASVVKAIFMVIVADGLFAVFFAAIGF
ncbi:MlaE family lipid ABC transporter permease subunit [Devosia nitrariae]|uniref:MlaE family lipid ABC transporter permease subunit n=1 Tax=Devosia nitrariae TaxID=2071872 RepID=UPI0024E09D33|nr:MlaE family lipid ABC transporter permease subunit [Devosia nitrariae]